MSVAARSLQQQDSSVPACNPSPQRLLAAAECATRRIAPLWPLKHFVAVNPFLGVTELAFADAAQRIERVSGARLTMPRKFYLDAIASGRIGDEDLASALQRARHPERLPRSVAVLKQAFGGAPPAKPRRLETVADVASEVGRRDWSGLVCERISSWAASHFDQGQASWFAPGREMKPYSAWREEAALDRTPQVLGLRGFTRIVRTLPDTAGMMISAGLAQLGVADAAAETYLHRLLMTISGWAGYTRYLAWQSELRGRADSTVLELLAIRLAWDVVILEAHRGDPAMTAQWQRACERLRQPLPTDAALELDHVLQAAFEIAWQRRFIDQLRMPSAPATASRKAVQMAFCIDVRSEVFRRALESVTPTVETLGVAGFFGMPIEFVPLGHADGSAQCPVLLAPTITVREGVRGASPQEEVAIAQASRLRRRVAAAWKWFKLAAVSSFAFVESMGWTYAIKLVADSLRAVAAKPAAMTGAHSGSGGRLAPEIAPGLLQGRAVGIEPDTRIKLALGALQAMSLRKDFARLVVLAGHGSTSVNNPHASGLDCGACGGHSGAANARVAAGVLNDPAVRRALTGRGIAIPDDTWFVGALHNTTTDEVTLFDHDKLPATHAEDLARLRHWLADAARHTRAERARALNVNGKDPIDAAITGRSRDWSQVRPEWGLAGCAAYIIAPRWRTTGLDFAGRVFLNSYDWTQDEDFAVLESIMTAPMVVGAWINLQYYASTVDNQIFGCGNKVLHNIVGRIGVLEGNGGDLRTGLPWQSVHDGGKFVHEPMRMSVVIAAPVEAINAVIAKHESVRELVENEWLHLFAWPAAPAPLQRYRGSMQWEAAA